jgi:hypothetical protein
VLPWQRKAERLTGLLGIVGRSLHSFSGFGPGIDVICLRGFVFAADEKTRGAEGENQAGEENHQQYSKEKSRPGGDFVFADFVGGARGVGGGLYVVDADDQRQRGEESEEGVGGPVNTGGAEVRELEGEPPCEPGLVDGAACPSPRPSPPGTWEREKEAARTEPRPPAGWITIAHRLLG